MQVNIDLHTPTLYTGTMEYIQRSEGSESNNFQVSLIFILFTFVFALTAVLFAPSFAKAEEAKNAQIQTHVLYLEKKYNTSISSQQAEELGINAELESITNGLVNNSNSSLIIDNRLKDVYLVLVDNELELWACTGIPCKGAEIQT